MATIKKAKKGGSFPDLNKDGKITKADILKGRGVIARKGTAVKKAQNGVDINKSNGAFAPIAVDKAKFDSVLNKRRASIESNRDEFNKKLKEAKEKIKLSPYKKALPNQKMGGKTMKKCKYGCK